MKRVAIINYNMGNIQSVVKKIQMLGHDYVVTHKSQEILAADKIVLPGVGHFGMAMDQLQKMDLIAPLNEAVQIHKKPVLGICLGMQLMADSSEEGHVEGLGWISGAVKRFEIEDKKQYKVPHIGWNQIEIEKMSPLMDQIPNHTEFYFVHAYYFSCHEPTDCLNTTHYEKKFVSAIEKNHIFGVQYHPEKSHVAGMQLFKNFLKLESN